jgi:hypothetical protein
MRWMVSLFLGIALVAGMSHAPAMAHPDEAHAHSSGEISTAESASENHHEDSKPSPGNAESNAHTHLPPALATVHDTLFGRTLAAKKQFLFAKTDVLTSFSQAPPTEPPSA